MIDHQSFSNTIFRYFKSKSVTQDIFLPMVYDKSYFIH